jgi:hypothetical protein
VPRKGGHLPYFHLYHLYFWVNIATLLLYLLPALSPKTALQTAKIFNTALRPKPCHPRFVQAVTHGAHAQAAAMLSQAATPEQPPADQLPPSAAESRPGSGTLLHSPATLPRQGSDPTGEGPGAAQAAPAVAAAGGCSPSQQPPATGTPGSGPPSPSVPPGPLQTVPITPGLLLPLSGPLERPRPRTLPPLRPAAARESQPAGSPSAGSGAPQGGGSSAAPAFQLPPLHLRPRPGSPSAAAQLPRSSPSATAAPTAPGEVHSSPGSPLRGAHTLPGSPRAAALLGTRHRAQVPEPEGDGAAMLPVAEQVCAAQVGSHANRPAAPCMLPHACLPAAPCVPHAYPRRAAPGLLPHACLQAAAPGSSNQPPPGPKALVHWGGVQTQQVPRSKAPSYASVLQSVLLLVAETQQLAQAVSAAGWALTCPSDGHRACVLPWLQMAAAIAEIHAQLAAVQQCIASKQMRDVLQPASPLGAGGAVSSPRAPPLLTSPSQQAREPAAALSEAPQSSAAEQEASGGAMAGLQAEASAALLGALGALRQQPSQVGLAESVAGSGMLPYAYVSMLSVCARSYLASANYSYMLYTHAYKAYAYV